MAYKEITPGMSTAEKVHEKNKRAAIRNFFLSSKVDQDKSKEAYKISALREKLKLQVSP